MIKLLIILVLIVFFFIYHFINAKYLIRNNIKKNSEFKYKKITISSNLITVKSSFWDGNEFLQEDNFFTLFSREDKNRGNKNNNTVAVLKYETMENGILKKYYSQFFYGYTDIDLFFFINKLENVNVFINESDNTKCYFEVPPLAQVLGE